MDLPDSVEDQLAWLEAAGFEAEARSVRTDLAVLVGRLRRGLATERVGQRPRVDDDERLRRTRERDVELA